MTNANPFEPNIFEQEPYSSYFDNFDWSTVHSFDNYYNVYLKGKRSTTEVIVKAKDPEQAKSIYCELEGFDKTSMSSKIYILGLRN